MASKGVLDITERVIVTMTSVMPIPLPTASTFDQVSRQKEGFPTAQNMSDLVIAFNGAMAALATIKARAGQSEADLSMAVINNTGESSASSIEGLPSFYLQPTNDLPSSRFIVLIGTLSSHGTANEINAMESVCTVPANATDAQDSDFRRLVDNINTWLPYVEALGVVAVVCEVVKIFFARVRMRRNRRAQQAQA